MLKFPTHKIHGEVIMKIKFLLIALVLGASCSVDTVTSLKEEFKSPPDDARPGVYWYFMDGNLNKEDSNQFTPGLSTATRVGRVKRQCKKESCSLLQCNRKRRSASRQNCGHRAGTARIVGPGIWHIGRPGKLY